MAFGHYICRQHAGRDMTLRQVDRDATTHTQDRKHAGVFHPDDSAAHHNPRLGNIGDQQNLIAV